MANSILNSKVATITIGIMSIGWLLSQLIFSFIHPVHPMVLLPIFLSFAFCIVCLTHPFPGSDKYPFLRIYDYLVIPVCAWVCYVFFTDSERILTRIPHISDVETSDVVAFYIVMILLMDTMRRVLGWNLLSFVSIFIIYGFLGGYLPGILNFQGFDVQSFVEIMTLSSEGVYGTALSPTANYIFYFILFGAFFSVGGGGELLIDIGMKLSDPKSGGPAKAAVLSSGLMGMVSGSAVANVTTTGVLTIPLMKKVGYRPHEAGAIEAVASTGGQIMPPIMGVGAFIMAELLGINYGTIAVDAIIPAVAYFGSVFLLVGFLAKKNVYLYGAASVGADELLVKSKPVLPRIYLLGPCILLVVLVLAGYSLRLSACYATLLVFILNIFNPNRLNLKQLYQAFLDGIRQAANIVIPVAGCGVIIGVVVQSGLANKFSAVLAMLGGSYLIGALLLAMACCMMLGMAMPTVAAYLISVTLFASPLVNLGLPIFIAHMFCFYFGVMAQLTPPVCLASFTAAGIADANPWKTGWTAFSYAIVAFIVPFAFAYEPALLLQGDSILTIVTASISLFAGCYGLAVAISGFHSAPLATPLRCILVVTSICGIIPGFLTDIICYCSLILILIYNHLQRRKTPPPSDSNPDTVLA